MGVFEELLVKLSLVRCLHIHRFATVRSNPRLMIFHPTRSIFCSKDYVKLCDTKIERYIFMSNATQILNSKRDSFSIQITAEWLHESFTIHAAAEVADNPGNSTRR